MTTNIEEDLKYFIDHAKLFGSEWRGLFVTPALGHAKIWMRGLALTAEGMDVPTHTYEAQMYVDVNGAQAHFLPTYSGCWHRVAGKGPFPQIAGMEHLHTPDDKDRIMAMNRSVDNPEVDKYLRRT